MITARINLSKIDHTKVFGGKNGAQWVDLVFIPTPNNQYGNDYMVVQGVSRQEREAGNRGAILGNAKETHKDRGGQPAETPVTGETPPESDDVPF